MEFLTMVDIFSIFVFEMEIYCQDRFQKPSLLTNWNFFANRAIYFWYKLPNQMKNSYSKRKFSDWIRWLQKNNSRGCFCELSDELLNRIWSAVYRYCINSILCKVSFFFFVLRLIWEDSKKKKKKKKKRYSRGGITKK